MSDLIEMDLIKLMDDLGSEDECRTALKELRWPNGKACIRCGSTHLRYTTTRMCSTAALAGMSSRSLRERCFHDTHLPLKKWFLAVYLMTESKKGICPATQTHPQRGLPNGLVSLPSNQSCYGRRLPHAAPWNCGDRRNLHRRQGSGQGARIQG